MITAQVGVTTQHFTVPYITSAMFKAEATGLPTDALTPRGTPQQQDDQLARYILKASSEMDLFCYGASGGCLRATTDTETLRVRMSRDGFFHLSPRLTPVRALTSFSSGSDVAAMSALSDLSHVEVEQASIRVPAYPFTGFSSAGPLQFGAVASTAYEMLVTYSYVNGWPLTALSAPVSAGAVTLNVGDATGVYTGAQLIVRDPLVGDEAVTVTGVTANQVSITALVHDHLAGVQVDGLPVAFIDACVEITMGLLKRRAQEGARSPQGRRGGAESGDPGEDNLERGFGLLDGFVQVRTR
ncbi:hypothetical protein [Streptomyces mirabilis]|uniref:hypothetical protein n=1 Tax=Streptomyces mirabilis TaxID=68239 RepID=UPI0036DE3ADD